MLSLNITYLRCEYKRLHEPAHGLHVIGELSHHLHYNPIIESGMGIHVTDLCVAVLEI